MWKFSACSKEQVALSSEYDCVWMSDREHLYKKQSGGVNGGMRHVA